MMTDAQRLSELLQAESWLKNTKAGYGPDRPWWKRAMPKLWKVRLSLRGTELGNLLAEAHGLLKLTEKGYDPRAPRWRDAMRLIDQVETSLARPPIPNLGPVEPGGKPILLQQLSHETAGLFPRTGSHFPAWDFGWDAGDVIVAPEPLRVTKQSSAQGADAFYVEGESTIEYWVGHVQRAPATGERFRRGEIIARIAAIPGVDHGHIGVNAKPLIGRDLRWGRNGNGPDYTWGAPTIGNQLTLALAA
jgi:hypothetical protein